MKYVIRRAVIGLIAMPIVAGVYFLGYAVLVGLGAEPGMTASETWDTGMGIAFMVAIAFAFWTQINNWLDKIEGGN